MSRDSVASDLNHGDEVGNMIGQISCNTERIEAQNRLRQVKPTHGSNIPSRFHQQTDCFTLNATHVVVLVF